MEAPEVVTDSHRGSIVLVFNQGRPTMPAVSFTPQLNRFLETPSGRYPGATVREALLAACDASPKLRGYLFDDQLVLRFHVAVFVNGRLVQDRERLTDAVVETDDIYVFQALSGG